MHGLATVQASGYRQGRLVLPLRWLSLLQIVTGIEAGGSFPKGATGTRRVVIKQLRRTTCDKVK